MTIVDQDPTSQRAPWAKKKILETATELFYREGIRLVGVDRLINSSQVTKATFYKHYRAKENLVVAYVSGQHTHVKDFVDNIVRDSASPRAALEALIDHYVAELRQPGFRGCHFLNAAAEYPEADHAIRQLVRDHRDWFSTAIQTLLGELGHPLPGDGADEFLLAYDGAMSGGYAGDPIAAAGAFQRTASRILDESGN